MWVVRCNLFYSWLWWDRKWRLIGDFPQSAEWGMYWMGTCVLQFHLRDCKHHISKEKCKAPQPEVGIDNSHLVSNLMYVVGYSIHMQYSKTGCVHEGFSSPSCITFPRKWTVCPYTVCPRHGRPVIYYGNWSSTSQVAVNWTNSVGALCLSPIVTWETFQWGAHPSPYVPVRNSWGQE